MSSRRGSWWTARRPRPKANGTSAFVLGGFGVQDALYAKGAPVERRGTTLRCYDGAIDAWRVCWMIPADGEFVGLVARVADGKIIQEGGALDGRTLERWTFARIESESFTWQGEQSSDGGVTWRLAQQIAGRRASS